MIRNKTTFMGLQVQHKTHSFFLKLYSMKKHSVGKFLIVINLGGMKLARILEYHPHFLF